ncbi:DNA-binding domain-containing protein [Chitinophaga sp. LS1]|uniref:DNA-binding domain-containing protein n=1 Tax=Chitinophaga sp. LS1 TaxID=3051176 RepID=UPI002AABD13C|nr:DNA-binding domain-containing protein [Chitinophaga sp. LS1]WPV65478.1 DNA-binding domain-containing protein [Chitinophaga sp. LS1]
MSELANIQKWLTSIIIKPGRLNDKVYMADQCYHLNHEKVILSTAGMPAMKKIEIYAKGYVLRLMECMKAEYPALLQLLGPELFNIFASAYLASVPPASPNLYDLGLYFPTFLRGTLPKEKVSEEPSIYDLPVEVAIFERSIAEASRSKGIEGRGKESTYDNQMLYLLDTTSIRTSPCLILLQLHFPLAEFIKAVQRLENPPTPDIKESFAAISRSGYIVQIGDLELWQWQFLKALQNHNDYLVAISIASQKCGVNSDSLMADLMLWIPLALKSGYIYRDGL